MSPLFIILTGPSGSGKSTILDLLLTRRPFPFQRFVTCTTRDMRPGEINGKDYWFLSKEEFEKDIAEGFFFEWANVYGNFYGSSKKEIERLSTSTVPILMVVDVHGAHTLKQIVQDAFILFIDAPKQALLHRLEHRGTTPDDLERRSAQIEEEETYQQLAHASFVNEDGKIEETYQTIVQTIQNRLNS